MTLAKDSKIVVAGGGGFIGGHLIGSLIGQGFTNLRAVDIKPQDQWYQVFDQVENVVADLRDFHNCKGACEDASHVYNLACDMGGMGFIENNKALCMISVLINTHLLMAARESGVERFFFASSACVYNAEKQLSPEVDSAERIGCLPGHARRRLRLGKTVLGTDVSTLQRGLWTAHAGRPIPQRVWPTWHLGWRT